MYSWRLVIVAGFWRRGNPILFLEEVLLSFWTGVNYNAIRNGITPEMTLEI
jgi:hypothetical protein